jgi:hypothetical protein
VIAQIDGATSASTEQAIIDGLAPNDRVYVARRFGEVDRDEPPTGTATSAPNPEADAELEGTLRWYPDPTGHQLMPTGAQAADDFVVSTGSCKLFKPRIDADFNDERAREGLPAYFYAAGVMMTCASTVESEHCYSELWRGTRVDGGGTAILVASNGTEGDSSSNNTCVASAIGGYYRHKVTHWSKNVLSAVAPPGNFWGNGAGPSGWACGGQGTHVLSCRRDVVKTLGQ